MELTDVRRLTGSNLIMDRPGAAGEAKIPAGREGVTVALWRRQMRLLLNGVGWQDEVLHVRPYPGGASLATTAPIDALYAATDMIEWAWAATIALLEGEAPADAKAAIAEFSEAIADERNPRLIAIARAADMHDITFLHGEDTVSVGLGVGGRVWPEDALPDPGTIDWQELHDIPLALVTGTNGKSTTVRLTAAIGAAAGKTVGLCSSDWVRVGGEVVDEGDYSGPGGARRAVRDPRVEMAVLEVARGGLLRRGLSIPRARTALITNVAVDHLGEYGVLDLDGLTATKFLIARTVSPGGRLVLNADDPNLVHQSLGCGGDITWFTLTPDEDLIAPWCTAGGEAVFVADGSFVLAREGERIPVLKVDDFPLGMKGAARFNLANALGAIALASALDLPVTAMAEGLAGFSGGPDENPGRANFLELGGVTVLVDFAHNPHGVAALIEAIEQLPAKRRLILLGQAGDRRDEDIRELTRIVWQARPARIIVKEMLTALRGRAAGEVPELIAAELEALGAPGDLVGRAESEMEAVHQALDWAESGDLLILLLHTERMAALALFAELEERGWQPGDPVDC